MLARVRTCSLLGVDALPVRVEVNLASGLPAFTIVGMAQSAVREGRERVTAALANSGYSLPLRKITVNLAPAGLRKEGTGLDLAIALGVLAGSGQLVSRGPPGGACQPSADDRPASGEPGLDDLLVLGELGLDGAVRPVPGVLPAALLAREAGLRGLVVPAGNLSDALMVAGVRVWPVSSLHEAVSAAAGQRAPCRPDVDRVSVEGERSSTSTPGESEPDLAEVRGQAVARRALEISAAGGHNLLMIGPPGAGKTMLARRLPGILPPLDPDEALEVARVRSVTRRPGGGAERLRRPFRAPHHTVSYAGLVGGGTPVRPGEISLAHGGVLFLDELGEFDRRALESLRQPMEEGELVLARATEAVRLPARFVLVAAMNPCPCGHLGDASDRCRCDDRDLARYRGRLSGPLLDRLDVRVEVQRPPGTPLDPGTPGEPTTRVAARVRAAREVQALRYRGLSRVTCNARAPASWLRAHGGATDSARDLLGRWGAAGTASARGLDRVVRVARTIADLDGSTGIEEQHLAEAIQYRVAATQTPV